MSYQDTSLWKRTLGLNDKIVEPFKLSFEKARDNATFLLSKIRTDFPNLTVHDITHVDSLWNVADTIIGKDYNINPLEGYVLGIAFLIHDAALSYETVGGIDKLRKTIEWQDAYADGPGDLDTGEFEKACDFEAIRLLHAKKAESILGEVFHRDNGTTFYIINEDITVYNNNIPVIISHDTFNETIGKVAASHHWNIDEVESILSDQIDPPYGVPNEWTINEQKLACILRCADAGHIDNGRAPDSIYRSLVVNDVSRQHWEAQRKLGQVREDGKERTKLRITSTKSFEKEDFAAWNVAYDAVRLFDEELKKSNELLKSSNLSFPHIGISGADSKEALSKYIKTKGWQPCSFGVHTGNVKALIEHLGGDHLYGEEPLLLVSLRELIQNARDAIQARRMMDSRFGEGQITIRLKEDERGRLFEVEDNGIGMSLDCIKHHLLDFGSSYWKSSLLKYEHPGLRSKGYKSVGKFGIGFYSVFMVAKSVEVVTKRYDKEAENAKKIEFPSGLTLSPILSETELNPSVSTVVSFVLKDSIDLEFCFRGIYEYIIPLAKALSIVVAGLDVAVYFEEKSKLTCIHSNVKSLAFNKEEWLKGLFIGSPINIGELAGKLEKLIDEEGELRGWILPPEWVKKTIYSDSPGKDYGEELIPCIKTIGGLASGLVLSDIFYNSFNGYLGYIDGIEENVSRKKMVFDKSLKKCMQLWVKRKYYMNYDDIISNKNLADSYHQLISFCGMEDMIVNDNMIRFYSNKQLEIDIGTIKSLIKMHLLFFAGVNNHAGDIKYGAEIEWGDESTIDALFELPIEKENNCIDSLFWKASKYDKDKHDRLWTYKIEKLVSISKMPASTYEDVINKYCMLVLYHPFQDGNKRVLGAWVNLILDSLIHKMIDWRKVDQKKLMKMIAEKEKETYLYVSLEKKREVSRYLSQFLSSSYLIEFTTFMDTNS